MAIPSTDLVFHVDHNDPASWPGSGSSVTDLVTNTVSTISNVTQAQGAFDFNGNNSEMEFANDPSWENIFSGGGTIAFAIRIESDGQANFGFVASTTETLSGTYGWSVFTGGESAGSVHVELFFPNGGGWWRYTVTLNEWHVVVITYDSGSTANDPTFYVDGVAVSETEVSAPTGTSNSDAGRDLGVGNRPASGNRCMDGQIDAIALWDRVLSASEAEDVYDTWAPRYAEAPQITNVTPAVGSEIEADTELGFDLTDATGLLLPVVYAPAATGDADRPVAWEVVHDGTNFLAGYSGTRSAIANGYRYRITRDAGWNVENPQLTVLATDADGNDVEVP